MLLYLTFWYISLLLVRFVDPLFIQLPTTFTNNLLKTFSEDTATPPMSAFPDSGSDEFFDANTGSYPDPNVEIADELLTPDALTDSLTKLKLSVDNSSSPLSSSSLPPPIYITIGPQCCGKTTALSSLGDVVDFTIDDQMGVYLPVPREHFLKPSEGNFNVIVRGRTLKERVEEGANYEQRIVLERLMGKCDAQSFKAKLTEAFTPVSKLTPALKRSLFEAVEQFIADRNSSRGATSSVVDCFSSPTGESIKANPSRAWGKICGKRVICCRKQSTQQLISTHINSYQLISTHIIHSHSYEPFIHSFSN